MSHDTISQYLRVLDLHRSQIESLLDLANGYRDDPQQDRKLLRGESVFLHFAKPSTRTRLAFQTAVSRLGAQPIVTGATDLQLGRGETIEDTAMVVSRMCAAAALRTYDHSEVERFASAASVPTINLLSNAHHPTQALADLLTIRSNFGRLKGVRMAYVGAGNNVCHSLIEACAITGVDLSISTPDEYSPDPNVIVAAVDLARLGGGKLKLTTDPFEAVKKAQVVYTDVWLSMGDDAATAAHRRDALMPFRVSEAMMEAAAKDAIFLHCLPAHRGDEVDAEVIDGKQSRVFDQAENRLLTAQAILAAGFRKL
jgi:ornithine carbamoyltransferase